MIQIIPFLIASGETILAGYIIVSSVITVIDLYKQTQYYLNKGYSPEEAIALAFQDEAVEIVMQIATPPEGKVAIKLGEKFLLNPKVAKLIVKTSVEIAEEIAVKTSQGALKPGGIKKTTLEIEKKVYAEVKDILKDFSDVNVVDKITIPDQVRKIIDTYQGKTTNTPSTKEPSSRKFPSVETERVQDFPRINSPKVQASTNPVLKGTVEKTVIKDDAKAKLDDFFKKGQELKDSIDAHNKLTPEELGKQIAKPNSVPNKTQITQEHIDKAAEIVEKIYNPQTPEEHAEMLNDVQKIGSLKNISEQEIQRVVSQKGQEILAQNVQLKAQGLPQKELKDIYKESIDELVNTDNAIESGKNIAKSIMPTATDNDTSPSLPQNPTLPSSDTTITETTLEPKSIFAKITDKIVEWVKKEVKAEAESVIIGLLATVIGGNPAPVPVPPAPNGITSGGGDVHVKGYDRNGHPVKPYNRSRPSN